MSEITYLLRTRSFEIDGENLSVCRKLLTCVLANIESQLKYERSDFLNKEYTHDTINFLREFLPKYIKV